MNTPGPITKRRPGAPNGNMNALKGGRSSKQFRLIAAVVRAHPGFDNAATAPELLARLLPDVLRADTVAQKQAAERARQIMAPYQPERFIERIAQRLLLAVLQDQAK
jgi:hypothetical protein